MSQKYTFTFLLLVLFFAQAAAHNPASEYAPLQLWQVGPKSLVYASFLAVKNDSVLLELASGEVNRCAIGDLPPSQQAIIEAKNARIDALHQQQAHISAQLKTHAVPTVPAREWAFGIGLCLFLGATLLAFARWPRARLAVAAVGVLGLLAFKGMGRFINTDPTFIDAAFTPFKPEIATHWDANWFYVESKGIPTTHSMMTGITKWQQQVPLPQCYLGQNAWQIPLNPVLAPAPVPVNPSHFLRGAVALAANGVPIFNPYTNTGVDAFLDGQLDQWGGHSGRADDYHYHLPPLHLDSQTADILPIAFALDGFAVYGSLEPDGSPMLPLDNNHGHFDNVGTYHYHGTVEAPYMIGKMVGKVTEDSTLQIIPQPKATPVRPSLTPLNGAVITNFEPLPGGNGYLLTYTRNNQTYKVQYSWTSAGKYTYQFITPSGTNTEMYNGFIPCEIPTPVTEAPSFAPDISIFPNPLPQGYTLHLMGQAINDIVDIQVWNAQGKLMYHSNSPADIILPKNLWSKGVYWVNITFKQGNVCKKVIAQ
jgi:hypothetical protein